jgi:hypothetical protein
MGQGSSRIRLIPLFCPNVGFGGVLWLYMGIIGTANSAKDSDMDMSL